MARKLRSLERKPQDSALPEISLDVALRVHRRIRRYGESEYYEGSISDEEIAEILGQSPRSGTLKGKIHALCKYGLCERTDKLNKMTPLGMRLAEDNSLVDLLAAFKHYAPFSEVYGALPEDVPVDLNIFLNETEHSFRYSEKLEEFSRLFIRSAVNTGILKQTEDSKILKQVLPILAERQQNSSEGNTVVAQARAIDTKKHGGTFGEYAFEIPGVEITISVRSDVVLPPEFYVDMGRFIECERNRLEALTKFDSKQVDAHGH
ncbi:hypothetical protein D2E25_1646 [Bifidobacterium goeldii]|uniref:Uncharacterized protein n=1 Tax=Bifidobacterium goeldii TaxID=2306975 RepID=A0A430FH76_9BIFI|nr:hypothetical protein [Bifidobacterium goeldii]RSX52233.1 hypothetical protein D2E25_1646 [Bifidobacterium goeldii]